MEGMESEGKGRKREGEAETARYRLSGRWRGWSLGARRGRGRERGKQRQGGMLQQRQALRSGGDGLRARRGD